MTTKRFKLTQYALICALIAISGAIVSYGVRVFFNHVDSPSGVSSLPPVAVTKQLPSDLRLNDLSGQPHSLTDWKGKVLLLNFWASWCGPCLDEMPLLLAAERKYGPAGLQIIGVAIDDPEAAQQVQADLHLDFPILVGNPETLINLMKALGNNEGGLPFSLLVSADGRIVFRQLGQFASKEELKALIEANLAAK